MKFSQLTLLLVTLLVYNTIKAQVTCAVTVSPLSETICLGDSVLVNATANLLGAGQAYDFNGGTLPAGWNTTGSATFSQPCGTNPTNTPYFWAATAGSSTPQISTAAFDISCGGFVQFDMVYSVQSGPNPCEGPDMADEGVELQYSIDGGATWIPIEYYQPDGTVLPSNPNSGGQVANGATPFTTWGTFTVPIPPGAVTTSTMFQWVQANSSGADYDNWGLDNIIINATGGNCGAVASIEWNNGMDSSSYYVTPTADTSLFVYVYDSLGNLQCISDTIEIEVNIPGVTDAGPDQDVCFGDLITLNSNPSNTNSTFNWSFTAPAIVPTPGASYVPNSTSQSVYVQVGAPGLYHFIFEENEPVCGSAYDTVDIHVHDISITPSFVAPSCFGLSDAEIHVNSQGATEFSYDGGTTWVPDSFALNLSQGTHSVCARVSTYGCEVCEDVTITDPTPLNIVVSNDTTICQNGTGNLSAFVTSQGSYSYHWDQTTNLDSLQQVNPLATTVYSVYAESAGGCTSQTESITVTVLPPLTGDISPFDTVCPGYSTQLAASVTGGIGQPYTFTWSSGDIQTGANFQNVTVTPASTETYTVTIEDQCETTPLVMQTTVVVSPIPVPQYEVLDPEQCEPAVFHIVNRTNPDLSEHNYWWIEQAQEFVNQDTIVTDSMWAGTYDLRFIVTTDQGCIDSIYINDALEVKPVPVADFSYSPNPVLMFNTNVYFNNRSQQGEQYHWFFEGADPGQSLEENVAVIYPDGEVGSYEVMLVTTSALGCVDTAVQILTVNPEVLIYAPNAFTPDGDEFNQSWRVYMEGVDLYDFSLTLYNRWGERIWESKDISVEWDGTYKGKIVEAGTYQWIIQAKDKLNDTKYSYNGHVDVLK